MADNTPDESQFLSKKKSRKLSWVGVDEGTPYSYLRESMVSNLMGGICDPQFVTSESNPKNLHIEEDRKQAVADAIGSWSFSAHNFTDDELLYGSRCILEHALQMDELEHWRMSTDELTSFLLASRAAYNDFVLYHNFRHVCDVLQAIFSFLVSIGILPPYPLGSIAPQRQESALADLLKPFDGLTLLIAAIGHDVGHPGVNNAFLVALNAPLAQLYNDRSVLESFHCAAYSQILRRYWPQAFVDANMRKLMIDSILATDMGLHFKYMSDLGNLQERFAHNRRTTDTWNDKILMEYRDLMCGLLIKCADISNVARKFDVAAQWANILTDEFSNQGRMEARLNIPTCLFGGPPAQDDYIKLGQSQIGFMNVFARPLFEAVTDILPGMQFAVDELVANKSRWDREIAQEKERQLAVAFSNPKAPGLLHLRGLRGGPFGNDGASPSPKSGSTEFLLPIPGVLGGSAPTSAPDASGAQKDSKSRSDPHPSASVEAQADEKRRLFNPNNITFGTPGESDAPQQQQRSQPPSTSYPSSRRGSADPSLTAILVTRQDPAACGAGRGGATLRAETWVKRGSVDSQTEPVPTGPEGDHSTISNGATPAKQNHHSSGGGNDNSGNPVRHKSPADSMTASEKGVVVMPDENAGSIADQKAWQRSDSLAAAGPNGNVVSPGAEENGMRVSARGAGKKSQSVPAVSPAPADNATEGGGAGGPDTDAAGGERDAYRRASKQKDSKSSFGKFWKKRWRAVSGVERETNREATRSKERLTNES